MEKWSPIIQRLSLVAFIAQSNFLLNGMHKKVIVIPKNNAGAYISFNKETINGNLTKIEEKLNAGFDPNTRDQTRQSPLFNAAFKGHMDIVTLLIKRGAN